jgi:hypothetical protein
VTKSPVKLSDLFRYYKALPHQMAGIVELESVLLKQSPDLLNRDQPWFKTWSQAGKQPGPIYLAPALRIIKEFEGCHLGNAIHWALSAAFYPVVAVYYAYYTAHHLRRDLR